MPSPPIRPISSVPNYHHTPHSGHRPTSPETLGKIIAAKDTNASEEKYFSTKSPYYKGLTDFSLIINKERLLVSTSPVRESDPPIPRSFSEPKVSENRQSNDQNNDHSLISWHKKIGNIIKRRNSLDFTNDDQFEEIDKKSPINQHDRRYSTSSPYYKGLTDFTLVLSKERLMVKPIHEDPTVHNPPPILQSISDPDMSETHQSLESNILSDPPPRSATSSEDSWPKKAVTNLIRKKNLESKKENLEEFDTKNENLEDKEKIPLPLSPDRESTTTSSSSRSSFIVKVQEWSASCFSPKKSHIENLQQFGITTTAVQYYNKKKDSTIEYYNNSSDSEISNSGKPLGERISQPAKRPPLSPPQPTFPAKTAVSLTAKEVNETEKEAKFFWADKYRPDALQDFICNQTKAIELRNLAKAEYCCHYIFEGLPGVGKRTMILAMLHEAFGADKVVAEEHYIQFDLKGEAVRSIQVNVKESAVHVEVNLSEMKGYEKHVIVELIKDTNKGFINQSPNCSSNEKCRAIILYEADKLSTDSLLYIRWLLERYKGFNKVFFFCCNDVSKLQPIKSLCTLVQLLPPSNEEIVKVLKFIAKQEGIDLPDQLADKIAYNSKNNLRQAIRSFEATSQSNPLLEEDGEILTGWEDDIAKIAKNIVEEQSPKQLYNIRGKLQNLIEHNVSPEFISQTLRAELKKHLDDKLHMHVDSMFEEYNRDADSEKPFPYGRNRNEDMNKREHDPVKKNVKHFMKIEELIAKFMSWYKSNANNKGKNVI